MSRQGLVVREASPEDAQGLVRLWSREASGHEPLSVMAEEAPIALAHIAADPDQRMMVGLHDEEVVAAMHMRRGPISPLHTEQVVHTSFLLVAEDFRRHGFAHALLESAVAWAEDKGVDRVTAIALSSSRDANRYLARLGLATTATLRVASTKVLRQRLMPERRGRSGAGSRRRIGQVLAQRRSMRRHPES